MADGDGGIVTGTSKWIAAFPVACSLVLIVVGATSGVGWIETVIWWPVSVVGIIAMVFAIWRYRQWALLLVMPVLAFPLIAGSLLLYECSKGNCL